MSILTDILLLGAGATALMDLWGVARQPLLGMHAPDYGLVGRWIGHMTRGIFRHESIAAAAPVKGERTVGWVVHYLIGIAYAAILLVVVGREWLLQPALPPALLVGIGTVVAPLFVMQPAMGMGIAARRTPHPWKARIHSVLMHTMFGLGLYLAGLTLQLLRS